MVGCAVARMLAIHGFDVVLLEKNNNIIAEASSGMVILLTRLPSK